MDLVLAPEEAGVGMKVVGDVAHVAVDPELPDARSCRPRVRGRDRLGGLLRYDHRAA